MGELDFVTVYHAPGMLHAQVVKGRLESAGVPVYLKYEAIGQVIGLTVDGLGLVQVQVPADWVKRAEEILAEPVEDLTDADEAGGDEADADYLS
ncbi:MAG TPA: DUF2007 domain-containing protein [Anaerolineae bacterium]